MASGVGWDAGAGWRLGAVAITGADGQIGRALRHRLALLPNRVVPLAREWDPASLADVEVVVHLAGTLTPTRPDTHRSSNFDTVRTLVDALRDSDVQRVVFLSFLTADPASPNPYLRAKGLAEQALESAATPATILRAGHVVGPPEAPGPTASAFLATRGNVTILGDGSQLLSPILLADVVGVLVHAALDPASPVGTFDLTGPEVLTADEFARCLNGAQVRLRHVPARVARALSLVVPALPRALVDVMLADTVPQDDPQQVAHWFGTTLHGVADAWTGRAASRTLTGASSGTGTATIPVPAARGPTGPPRSPDESG